MDRSKVEQDPGGELIGVRWVDHDKRLADKPNLRSRLVGKEFAEKGRRDDLFAPTPPLTAARMLVSRCASRGQGGTVSRLMLIDIKKAFLYGRMKRNVYIELPVEDPRAQTGDVVGKLSKAMHGTRDAPAVWHEELEKGLKAIGFVPCVVAPCLYYHPELGIRVVSPRGRYSSRR